MKQVSKMERTTLEGMIEDSNVSINIETDGKKPLSITAFASSNKGNVNACWHENGIAFSTSGYSIEEFPMQLIEGILAEFQQSVGAPIEDLE